MEIVKRKDDRTESKDTKHLEFAVVSGLAADFGLKGGQPLADF